MALEAQVGGHGPVAIPIVPVAVLVTVGVCQQCPHPQQRQLDTDLDALADVMDTAYAGECGQNAATAVPRSALTAPGNAPQLRKQYRGYGGGGGI